MAFDPLGQTLTLLAVGSVHLLVAPYTKVEESFNVQALHDFLFLSGTHKSWDHDRFPGVVHRTFLVNLFISLMAKPFQLMFDQKFSHQTICRFCLLALFCAAYYSFCRAIHIRFGRKIAALTTLLTISQFHLPFYASRTLPNTFALVFVLWAYAAWLQVHWKRFIFLVAFTVLVVRFETIILFGCILLVECFYTGKLHLFDVFRYGIPSGIVCLLATVLFDSYMWNKLVWPEGDTIWFNIFQNKSHLWGTQPFFWYFYHVLPNIYLVFVSVVPLTFMFVRDKFTFVAIMFIFLYSFLPHKELRFIIYAVPLLNLSAAQTILKLTNLVVRHSPRCLYRWPIFILTGAFLLNTALTGLKLYVSHHNYPGGNAISLVNEEILFAAPEATSTRSNISVYVCDLAAQSGFTRFLELDHHKPTVHYNKDPEFDVRQYRQADIIYLVIEPTERDQYLEHCALDHCRLRSDPIDRKCFTQYSVMTLEPGTITRFKIALNIYQCQA